MPAELMPVPELRLLAQRLGQAPSAEITCTPIGDPDGALSSCLGAPLPSPLDQAFLIEQLDHRKGQVVAVIAELGGNGLDPDAAGQRYQHLRSSLLRAYGPPSQEKPQRILLHVKSFTVTLELVPAGIEAARLYLELRAS